MKKSLFLICLFLSSCTVVHKYGLTLDRLNYNYITYNGNFKVAVHRFYKNNALCGSRTSYALVFAEPIHAKLPGKLSLLLACDNNVYKIGDTLSIMPQDNIDTLSKPIFITAQKTFRQQVYTRIVGAEYPAIWGRVISGAH